MLKFKKNIAHTCIKYKINKFELKKNGQIKLTENK